jgi:hypothetical protein
MPRPASKWRKIISEIRKALPEIEALMMQITLIVIVANELYHFVQHTIWYQFA